MSTTYMKRFAFHKFDDLVGILIAPSCMKISNAILGDKNNNENNLAAKVVN